MRQTNMQEMRYLFEICGYEVVNVYMTIKKILQPVIAFGLCEREVKKMNHVGTQTITTDRLILRRFTMDDAEPMFRNWANDPDVTMHLTWPTHSGVEVSKKVLENWVNGYEKDNFYQWAIVPKEYSEPIGSISIVQQREDIGMVHVGYCIGKKWWHKGFTSEALAALIDFFFDKVGVSRIEARHDPNNPNSGKVMKKCGMKYEGTMRRSDKNNKGICDASYYAILREEWKNEPE